MSCFVTPTASSTISSISRPAVAAPTVARSSPRSTLSEFYRFAHSPEIGEQTKALAEIKRLIGDGTRSLGWNLSNNVERAREDDHSEVELVAQLAKVIADEADAETLNKFPAWKRA